MPTKKAENQISKNGRPLQPLIDVEATHPLFPPKPSDILKSKLNSSLNSTVAVLATDNEVRVSSSLVNITYIFHWIKKLLQNC